MFYPERPLPCSYMDWIPQAVEQSGLTHKYCCVSQCASDLVLAGCFNLYSKISYKIIKKVYHFSFYKEKIDKTCKWNLINIIIWICCQRDKKSLTEIKDKRI